MSEAARKDPAMTGQYDYDRIENEFYPTPVGFVRCLAEHFPLFGTDWWEPCAGQGHIAMTVESITHNRVEVSDVVRYPDHPNFVQGFSKRVVLADFLALEAAPPGVDGLISNPPYLTIYLTDPEWSHLKPLALKYGMRGNKISLAELFLRHAIALMEPVKGKVFFFLRNEFDCGSKRMDLFKTHPAYAGKVVCTERPRWIEGSTGSPRHNYSWVCFDWTHRGVSPVFYSHPKTAKPLTYQ